MANWGANARNLWKNLDSGAVPASAPSGSSPPSEQSGEQSGELAAGRPVLGRSGIAFGLRLGWFRVWFWGEGGRRPVVLPVVKVRVCMRVGLGLGFGGRAAASRWLPAWSR